MEPSHIPAQLMDDDTIAVLQQAPESFAAWAELLAPLGPAWIDCKIIADNDNSGGDLLQDRASKLTRRIKCMTSVLSKPNRRTAVFLTKYGIDLHVFFVSNPSPLDQSLVSDGAKLQMLCFESPDTLQFDVCKIPAYPPAGVSRNVFSEVSEAIVKMGGTFKIVCDLDENSLSLQSLLGPDDEVDLENYVAAAAATAISAHFNCTVHVQNEAQKRVSVNGIKCCNGALLGVTQQQKHVSRGWNQIPLVTRTERSMSARKWQSLLLPKVEGRPPKRYREELSAAQREIFDNGGAAATFAHCLEWTPYVKLFRHAPTPKRRRTSTKEEVTVQASDAMKLPWAMVALGSSGKFGSAPTKALSDLSTWKLFDEEQPLTLDTTSAAHHEDAISALQGITGVHAGTTSGETLINAALKMASLFEMANKKCIVPIENLLSVSMIIGVGSIFQLFVLEIYKNAIEIKAVALEVIMRTSLMQLQACVPALLTIKSLDISEAGLAQGKPQTLHVKVLDNVIVEVASLPRGSLVDALEFVRKNVPNVTWAN